VQVHEHAAEPRRASRLILLSLARVDEHHRELIAVVGVVAAAAPHPVGGEVGGARPRAAAARRQLAVTARASHRVQHRGRHERLTVRRLSAACAANTPTCQSINQSVNFLSDT